MIRFTSSELAGVLTGGDEQAVRARALALDYRRTPSRQGALALAAVLLYPAPITNSALPELVGPKTPFGRWIARLERAGDPGAHTLLQWGTAARTNVALYPIDLYNRDWGDSRRVLQMLLHAEKRPPPYHWLVLVNMLHGRLGLSHDELHHLACGRFERFAHWIDVLLADHELAEQWLASKPQPLRFYGGATNTVLGLYDEIFKNAQTGATRLRKRAERRFDLGGGFATAEIERLTGASYTSADLLSPVLEDYDPELVIHETRGAHQVPADGRRRSAHLAAQRRVVRLPFDVLSDSLPTDARSYTIVSTGFMTSTVRPLKRPKSWKGTRFGHVGLSVHAVLRVVELAALGKDVDLFTIQRATSRSYKYKTCLLRWRRGRLVTLVTTDDKR